MDGLRIIKKYPNRRLYDTEISRYVTLDEIKTLVIQHIGFQVIDERSATDVTNHVLMQILMQAETGASPFFTREILKNLICFYGNPLQKNMSQFFETGLETFKNPDANLHEYFQHLQDKETLQKLANNTQANVDYWQTTLASFFNQTSHAEHDESTDSSY